MLTNWLTKLNGNFIGQAFPHCNNVYRPHPWGSCPVICRPCVLCFLVLVVNWSELKAAKEGSDAYRCSWVGVVPRLCCLLTGLFYSQCWEKLWCFRFSKAKQISYRLKLTEWLSIHQTNTATSHRFRPLKALTWTPQAAGSHKRWLYLHFKLTFKWQWWALRKKGVSEGLNNEKMKTLQTCQSFTYSVGFVYSIAIRFCLFPLKLKLLQTFFVAMPNFSTCKLSIPAKKMKE